MRPRIFCSGEQVELPTWGTLDRSCAWQAFADGSCQPEIVQRVLRFGPEAVLGVDWSSLPAFKALQGALGPQGMQLTYIYLNYRCCRQWLLSEGPACHALLLKSS